MTRFKYVALVAAGVAILLAVVYLWSDRRQIRFGMAEMERADDRRGAHAQPLEQLLAHCLSAGEVGELAVRAPWVSAQYWNRTLDDAMAKHADGNAVWHRTGDLGHVDERGRIWLVGRKSERVVVEGRVLYPEPCESLLRDTRLVRRLALIGLDGGAALVVEPTRALSSSERRALRAELLGKAAAREETAPIRTVLFHPGLPVDALATTLATTAKMMMIRVPVKKVGTEKPIIATAVPSWSNQEYCR